MSNVLSPVARPSQAPDSLLGAAVRRRLGRLPAVAVVLVAGWASISSAADGSLDDPVLGMALVPLIVAAALILRSGSEHWHIELRDGVVDVALGLPLVAIVAGAAAVAQVRLGVLSDALRIDMLLLAPTVAGLLLLWGTEQVWVFRREVASLLIAWPWPFAVALGSTLAHWHARLVGAAGAVSERFGAPLDSGVVGPSPLAAAVVCLVAAWLAHPLRLWRRSAEALAFAVFGLLATLGGLVVGAAVERAAGGGRVVAAAFAAFAVATVPATAMRSARTTRPMRPGGEGRHRRSTLVWATAATVSVAVVAAAVVAFTTSRGTGLTDGYGRAVFEPLGSEMDAHWNTVPVPEPCAVYAAAVNNDTVEGRRVVRTHTVSLDPGASNYRDCREELAPFVPDPERSRTAAPGEIALEIERGPAYTGVRTAALVSWVWPVLEGERTRYERVVLAAYDDEPSALSDAELDQVVARLESEALSLIAERVALADSEQTAMSAPTRSETR